MSLGGGSATDTAKASQKASVMHSGYLSCQSAKHTQQTWQYHQLALRSFLQDLQDPGCVEILSEVVKEHMAEFLQQESQAHVVEPKIVFFVVTHKEEDKLRVTNLKLKN